MVSSALPKPINRCALEGAWIESGGGREGGRTLACPRGVVVCSLAEAGLVAVVAGSTEVSYGRIKLWLCSQMPSSWLPTADLDESDNPWF